MTLPFTTFTMQNTQYCDILFRYSRAHYHRAHHVGRQVHHIKSTDRYALHLTHTAAVVCRPLRHCYHSPGLTPHSTWFSSGIPRSHSTLLGVGGGAAPTYPVLDPTPSLQACPPPGRLQDVHVVGVEPPDAAWLHAGVWMWASDETWADLGLSWWSKRWADRRHVRLSFGP